MNIIDGRKTADELLQRVKAEAAQLSVRPGLAVIIVGNDPASLLYVKRKREAAISCGMKSFIHRYDSDIDTSTLKQKLVELNNDINVHGILVQLPLPPHINALEIINTIAPSKDVDGFTIQNIGKLITKQDGLFPCTPLGCLHLIKTVIPNLKGLHAVVIGRSNIVGRPMSNILLNEGCTVTIIHRETKNPEALARQGHILVSATGHAGLITEKWVNKDMIVIDVGISRVPKGDGYALTGDVDFNNVKDKVKAITPVPGGVGPMTIAYLLKNTLKAAQSYVL